MIMWRAWVVFAKWLERYFMSYAYVRGGELTDVEWVDP